MDLDPRALDRAFVLARDQVADGIAPFVILGVATGTGVVRLEAASRSGMPRIGSDAVCLIASITKPMVATTIMQLVAEGRLTLGAPLEAVIPELAIPDAEPVTAWHLMSHTSGMVDIDIEQMIGRGDDVEDVLREAIAADRAAPPGTAFSYTTTTFNLLAEAVARLDGVPFEVALHRRLLDPLGMTSTMFDPRPVLAARMAPIRIGPWDPELPVLDPATDPKMDRFIALQLAGGGLWSSASDLLRFGRAMLRGGELDGVRILPRAQLQLMTREVTGDGLGAAADRLRSRHYALAWGKPGADDPGSRRAFGHGGGSGTRLWIDPEHDLVFVYLTGVWGFDPSPIERVAQAVYAALD